MSHIKSKQNKRIIRHRRIRAKISGTAKKPRVVVFKSNKGLFVQLIDDEKRITIMSNSSKNRSSKAIKKSEYAKMVGESLAKKAKEVGIDEVVFDRGGYKYHGRVKELADGLRTGGLKL